MTKEELKGYLDQFVRLGDIMIVFIPDVLILNRFLAYLRALAVSDALLTEVAKDLTTLLPQEALASTADVKLTLQTPDGAEELGGPAIFILLKLLMMFLTFFKQGNPT